MINTELKTYSNPSLTRVIENWPSGKNRATATFVVEQNNKGERACRTTTGKTKKLTYAAKVRFVDGSDNRLYIIEKSPYSDMISVMKGTFDYQEEVIHKSSQPERYEEILKLFA